MFINTYLLINNKIMISLRYDLNNNDYVKEQKLCV